METFTQRIRQHRCSDGHQDGYRYTQYSTYHNVRNDIIICMPIAF